MKITQRQLRRLVKEEKKLQETWLPENEVLLRLPDADSGRTNWTTVSTSNGVITIEFGDSFRVTLEREFAEELGDTIHTMAQRILDVENERGGF